MRLILICSVLVNFLGFSVSPKIVNGVKTSEFAPVVKLTFNSSQGTVKNNTCTGTFVKPGYILTAAHCIEALYLESLSQHINYLVSNKGDIPEFSSPEIRINNESFSRANGIIIHPTYAERVQKEFSLPKLIMDLDKSIMNNEISLEQAKNKVDYFRENIKKLRDKNTEYDLALINVKHKGYDKFYEVSDKSYPTGTPVKMVGFGHEVNIRDVMEIQSKTSLLSALMTYHPTNSEEYKHYYSDYTELIERLKEGSGIKRVGSNKVSQELAGNYIIQGNDKMAVTSWNKLTSYFYEWEEADGKNVSLSSGDSGGPLLIKHGKTYEVIGVASMAGYHESGNYISDYVNLSSETARSFIKYNIK